MYAAQPNLKSCIACLCLRNYVRKFSTSSSKAAKSHYDSLGITPAATQAQVKTAYYNLSKVYHPDRNDGSETSSRKFREVTAAYEVLGNVNLRKMYDKGLINDSQKHVYPEQAKAQFYRSRDTRTRPPPPDGRTPIYDFDEWSRQHYGSTFARDMHLKHRRRIQKMVYQHSARTEKHDKFLIMFLLVSTFLMYITRNGENYDKVAENHEKK